MIPLLRVSGGTVLFRVFIHSIVSIFLVVLHGLMILPFLIRGGIFQVTLGINVSRFNIVMADTFISSFM